MLVAIGIAMLFGVLSSFLMKTKEDKFVANFLVFFVMSVASLPLTLTLFVAWDQGNREIHDVDYQELELYINEFREELYPLAIECFEDNQISVREFKYLESTYEILKVNKVNKNNNINKNKFIKTLTE